MTKFVVYTDSYECRINPAAGATAEQIWAAYQAESSTDPRTIGSFASLDEAKAELEKFSPSTRSGKTNTGWVAWGALAWIEEEEHDEDDDFVCTNCIWSYSAEALPPEENEHE